MIDFNKIESKWQKRWKEDKTFDANPDSKKPKYFITVPYPYASGPLHVGHGLTFTKGDIFARYKRLKGFNVLYPMGYHVTGTPILAVSQQIRMNNKKAMNQYLEYIKYYEKNDKKAEEILNSFKSPENVMNFFANVIHKDFELMGFAIDWRRQFTTDDKEYNKFIEWQFKHLNDKQYLTQGDFPILYSTDDNNAVGEDDIKDGDTDPVEINEFVAIKFKIKNKNNTYLVASTLRPETIHGLTNLWINLTENYVQIEVGNENWIISKSAMEKLNHQKHEVDNFKTINPSSLINELAISPITNRVVKILPATFVDSEVGTGIVYSVPSSAPYDYLGLKDLQQKNEHRDIKMISIINMPGYSDTPAKELTEREKIENQKEREKIDKITKEIYSAEFHKGKMNKNCGNYSGLSVSDAKDKITKELIKSKKAFILYETNRKAVTRAKHKVIVAVLSNQWFLHYGNKEWKEKTKQSFKNIKIIPEIYRKLFDNAINWLDKKPVARKRGLGTKLPFDKEWIIESLSDSTIYMAFYTIIHILRENKIKSEQLIPEFWDYIFLDKGNEREVSNKTGVPAKLLKRMKSEFEYWYPLDHRHTAIAHISNHLSMMIFNHVAIFRKKHWPKLITSNEMMLIEGKKMSKSEGNVIPINKLPEKYFIDLFRAYVIYSAELSSKLDWRDKDVQALRGKLQQFYTLASEVTKTKTKKTDTTWLVSRFQQHLQNAENRMESYNPRQYFQSALYDIMNDVQYFIRRTGSIAGVETILQDWLKILSPAIPHICEELWSQLGNKTLISNEAWPELNKKKINKDIEQAEEAIIRTFSDINQILQITEKKPKNIYIYTVPPDLEKYASAESFLSNEFKAKIKVFANNDKNKIDPENKASKAKFGKPGIFIE